MECVVVVVLVVVVVKMNARVKDSRFHFCRSFESELSEVTEVVVK